MALKAHLEQTHIDNSATLDSRRAPRRALNLRTSAEPEGSEPANVTIHNLSAAGLLIETDLELAPGDRLAIGLPDVGPVGAEIVWASERLYGCAFEQALGEATLAASALQSLPVSDTSFSQAKPSFPSSRRNHSGDRLSSQLNRLRRERSLTLDQVAKALGVSKPTVWAWEKGKARPLPERLGAIAEVLGVSESELTAPKAQGKSGNLVEECRLRIASEYGTSPEYVRIMIEV